MNRAKLCPIESKYLIISNDFKEVLENVGILISIGHDHRAFEVDKTILNFQSKWLKTLHTDFTVFFLDLCFRQFLLRSLVF